jgi:hypothetical protein
MKLINLARRPAKPETYGERLAQAVGLSRMLSEFSEKKGFEPSVLYLASLITIASFNAVFVEEGRSSARALPVRDIRFRNRHKENDRGREEVEVGE